MAFNINGQIRLAGPNNLGQIVSNIKSQLQGITANVNINVPSNVTANVQGLAQNLNQVSQAAQTISNSGPQAAAGLNNMAGAAIRTSNAASQTSKSLRTLISSQYELGRASSEGTDSLRQFGEQAALAARRFVAFSVAAGSLISLFIAFKRGIGDALDFERQLIRLSQVGGDSSSTIRGLGDEITRVSRAYGASSNELAQVAVTIRQAGISANETKSILEALAKSNLSASFDSMGQSAEGLIAIMSQFRIQGSQAAEVLGSINAVSAGLAVEARDITAAVQRAGGAFAILAGNTRQPIENLREFIAIFSSVRATTRESAESIATGLRTIFSRLQNTATLDLLEKFNIRLRLTRQEADLLGGTNIAGNFVGVAEAIDRISARLQNVSQQSQTFADIVEQLGGQRQLSKVLPLLTEAGSGLREQARALSQTGALSLDDSAEKGLKGLLVQARQTGAAFAKLFQSITENTAFRTLAKSVLLLGSAFADALTFLKPFVSLITILAGVKLTKALLPIGEGFISRLTSSAGTNISGNINTITTPKRFALGGRVEGSGPTDSQFARVSPGEFILNPKAARGIGYDRLQKYNSGGQPKPTARRTFLHDRDVEGFRKLSLLNSEYEEYQGVGRIVLPGYSVSSQFTRDEKQAINSYAGASFRFINESLRGGKDLSGYPTYQNLSSAVGKGRLPGGLLLHRGINDKGREAIYRKYGFDIFDEGSIGKEFTDEGFISTSIFKGTAEIFGKNLLSMMTQENDSGIFLGRNRTIREGEVILPPSKFKILGGINGTTGLRKLAGGGGFDIRSLLGTPTLPDVFRSIIGDDKITDKLNSIIPAESKFFAAGTEAMTLLSPDNSIFRLGALGQKDSELLHRTGSIRRQSKLFLHPYDTHDLGYSDVTGRQVVLERLKRLAVKKDNAFSFEEGNTAAAITNLLAAKEGFSFDSHGGNVGVDHDIFKIIDPGLVSTHKSMLKLAEKEAPFNYADFLTKEGFVSYNKIKSVKPKFAGGGKYILPSYPPLQDISRMVDDKYGFNLSALGVESMRFATPDSKFLGQFGFGSLMSMSPKLRLNASAIHSTGGVTIREVLAHEFGHALDHNLAVRSGFGKVPQDIYADNDWPVIYQMARLDKLPLFATSKNVIPELRKIASARAVAVPGDLFGGQRGYASLVRPHREAFADLFAQSILGTPKSVGQLMSIPTPDILKEFEDTLPKYIEKTGLKKKFATGGLFLPDETSRFSTDVLKVFGYSKRQPKLPFAQPINYPNFSGTGQSLPAGLGFGVSSPQSNYPAAAGLLGALSLIPPFIRSGEPAGLGFGLTSAADQRFFNVPELPFDVANKSIPSNQELFAKSLSPSKVRGFDSEYLEPANLELLKKDLGLRPSGPAILNKPEITIPPEYVGNQDAITFGKIANKNFASFEKSLANIGIKGIDTRYLTSGILFKKDLIDAEDRERLGEFSSKYRNTNLNDELLTKEGRLIIAAHEVLGHAGDLALGGGNFITSKRKVSGAHAQTDELRRFGYGVSQIPSINKDLKIYGKNPAVLAQEGLAIATEEYVKKKLYDAGKYQPGKIDKELGVFKDLEEAGVFKYVEEKYLPRLAELTTGTSPESVKARKSLRKKLQIPESAYPELLGNLSKVQGFKDGGSVIPGHGNTDNVLANLPHGSFIIRKSSAQSIGYDALHQMAGKSSLSSSGGSGLALTMPGEFYFGPDQVKKIGTPILNSINKTGRLPAFASGGQVGGSYVGYTGTNVVGITDLIGRSIGNVISKLANAISSFTGAVFKSEQLVEKTGSQFVRFADQSAKARGEKFEPTGAYGAAGVAIYKAANRAVPAGSTPLEAELFSQTKATEFLRIQKEIADNRKEIKSLGGIQSDISGKSRADLISSITPAAMTGQIQNPRLAAFFAENKLDPSSKVDVAYGISAARQRQLELKQRNEALQEASGVTVNAAGDIVPNGLSPTKSRFQKFKDVLGFGGPAGTKEEQAQRRQIRALSLAYAAPVVAAGIDAFGGSADEAVRSGSSGKYIGSQATSGALTGASTGFLITGSPIGAVIGGLIGLTVSLVDSSKQIREAKIGEEIQKLATNFTAINTEFSGTGSLSERNRNNQSVAFGNASRLILDSRFGEIRNSGNREDRARTESDIQRAFRISGEGGELTPEQTTLTQQFGADVRNRNLFSADNLQYINIALRSFIRNNPNATSEDFGSQINEILGSRTLGAFFQSQILGGPRGTELQRTRLIEGERIRRTSVTDEAQTNFLFSNLGLVSQQLAASLDKLKQSVDQADNAIQGTGRVASVGFDASIANRPFDANFTSSIRDASSFLGEAGAPLNSFANTLSGIFQPLQNALINVNRANTAGSESFDIGSMVENELRNSLPADSANNPLIRIISANAAKFRESGVLDRGADVSAVAKQLIEDSVKTFGPAVREVFEAANKRLNTVIEGLNRYNGLLLQSVEFQNRAVQIRVATEKTQAQFAAQDSGLGDSATNLFFSASQARSQFTESQGNLLNTPVIRGILGNNTGQAGASEIGGAFRNVLAQINNFGPVTNANVSRFGELQDASARLRRALESLTDPTQRNADIQERLNRIQGSEQSRGSFNARYFTASPEERFNISQGVGLVKNIVSTGRDIGSYDDEQRSQIINTLQSLGRTNLAFAGGASGEEILNQILSNSRFGIEQAQGEGGQTQDLQRQFITSLNEARTANDILATAIRDNATVVQNNLTTSIRALDVTIANLATQLNTAPLPTTNSGLNLPGFLDEMFAPSRVGSSLIPFVGSTGFAVGGRVPMYASAGMFAPRGTDTVPAMLTPDEFVVRREQALANQALLEHINSSSGPVFSSGSVPPELRTRISPDNPLLGNSSRSETPVQYREEGGLINATSIREWYPVWNRALDEYLRTDSTFSPENARSNAALLRSMPSLNTFTNFARTPIFENIINRTRGGPPNPLALQDYLNFIYGIDNINDFSPDVNLPGPDLGVRPAVLAPRGAEIPANIGGPPPGLPRIFGLGNAPLAPNPDVLDFPDRQQDIGLFGLRNQYQANLEGNQFAVRNIGAIPEIRRDRFQENRLGLANTEIDAMTELNRTITSGSSNPFSAEGLVLAQQLNGLQGADSLYQAGIARNLRRAQNADLYYGDQAQSIRATAQGNIQGLGDIRRGFGFYNPATGQSDNLRSLGARSNLNFGRNARAFRRFEDGGPVSGPGVGDSIPALLANGEYVINAQAVRNAGGVATFDRINRFQNGGAVGTPTGTTVTLGNSGGGSPDFSRYVDASNSLSASMMVFNENARQLAESMKNFPTSITMEAKHTVEVIINGAEAFSRIKPEIQEMIITTTKKEISRVFKEKLPDVQPD